MCLCLDVCSAWGSSRAAAGTPCRHPLSFLPPSMGPRPAGPLDPFHPLDAAHAVTSSLLPPPLPYHPHLILAI